MRNIDLFDEYLNGGLTAEEKRNMELRLNEDAGFKKEFEEHLQFITILAEQQHKQNLKAKLQEIHQQELGSAKVVSLHDDKTFYQKFVKTAWIAASIAVVAVLTTITFLSFGGFLIKNQGDSITELGKKVKKLESNDQLILKNLNGSKGKKNMAPANVEGSGFALNNKGYFITSYHTIQGANMVYIENSFLEAVSARVVHIDKRLDLAILKIDSSDYLKNKDIPICFSSKESDLGEKVFTLGYPASDVVYGEGSLSAASGFGDTAMYQISIPINYGNSGGPVMDEYGNLIGIIRGKNQSAEGTGFAIKSKYIMDAIAAIDDPALQKELVSVKKNKIKHLKRSEQIKKLLPFIFNVKVYKN